MATLGVVGVLVVLLLLPPVPAGSGFTAADGAEPAGLAPPESMSPAPAARVAPATGVNATPGWIGDVPVGDDPTVAVVDPVTGTAYVLDSGGDHVHVLSNETVAARVGAGGYPGAGVFDPADGDVYVLDADSSNVTIYHGTEVVASLPTGAYPFAAAYDAADQEVYVTNYGGYNVTILNGTTGDASVPVARGVDHPLYLAYDPADGDVYVDDAGIGTSIIVLNGTTVEANLSLGGYALPSSMAYDPADGFLYFADAGTGNVSLLNGTAVSGTVSVGGAPGTVLYDPASGGMLVLNDAANGSLPNQTWSGTVDEISGANETGYFDLPFDPMGGAYDAAVSAAVLFGNITVPYVLAVDDAGIVATIPVRAGVVGVAYDPENQLAYLPNLRTDNVSVIGDGAFYPVTFSESGLPPYTQWTTSFDGIPVSSITSSLSIPLENGTYNYSISSLVRTNVFENGTGPENGSGDNGTNGSGNGSGGNGTNDSGNGTNQSRSYETNATIGGVPASGEFTVDGGAVVEPTAEMLIGVAVDFVASGLPSGTPWSITFNGTTETADGSSIAFDVPSGTYAYSLGVIAGYRETSIPSSGVLKASSADGPSDVVALSFTPVTYEIQLTEAGLPLGTTFSATVAGRTESVVVDAGPAALSWSGLANGSYPYAVAPVAGWRQGTIAPEATLIVDGGLQPIDGTGVGYAATLQYAAVEYNVTFWTLGLPATDLWRLTLNGTTYVQTAGNRTVALPNGTYDYSLADVPGWHQTTLPYAGTVTVDGANVTEKPFYFVQVTYRVTFAERGLPAGTNWSIVAGRQLANSTGVTITFQVANTTALSYVVGYVAGYSPMLRAGSFPVNGSALTVLVTFSANGHSSVPGWLVPGAVGAAVGVVVGVLLGRVLRPRREGPAPLTPTDAPAPDPGAPPVEGP